MSSLTPVSPWPRRPSEGLHLDFMAHWRPFGSWLPDSFLMPHTMRHAPTRRCALWVTSPCPGAAEHPRRTAGTTITTDATLTRRRCLYATDVIVPASQHAADAIVPAGSQHAPMPLDSFCSPCHQVSVSCSELDGSRCGEPPPVPQAAYPWGMHAWPASQALHKSVTLGSTFIQHEVHGLP